MAAKKPNILILFGDDIGMWNISYFSRGQMGYRTPNIDRVANEGVAFTDYYGQQSCTAGRAAFITGQNPVRTGLTKVGLPGATVGLQAEDPTIAELLKPLGYATGQFGKNHLGDRDEYLPTVHGFDEFFGNLYHLNAEEEPELPDYPKDPEFKKRFGPRGVLHCTSDGKGAQKIVDNGPENDTWPDGANTPFRSQKDTNWEGGWRVPAFIRWPGKIQPGTVLNGIVSHQDMLPTLLAAAGDPDVTDKLLKGYKVGNKTFKVHIDGYNL